MAADEDYIDFDWNYDKEETLLYRYSEIEDLIGNDLWMGLFEYQNNIEKWITGATKLLSTGSFFSLARPQSHPKRVFISHRQADYLEAKKAAKMLTGRKINVWLDIYDPTLQILGSGPGKPTLVRSLAIALIIEMALINCTHVLALLTQNTRGSMWVPYEYGRIKRGRAFNHEAGSLHLDKSFDPEYTYLGTRLKHFNDLNHWPLGP